MKGLLFICLLLTVLFVNAQCPQGGVQLRTQSEVDSFIIKWPDCKNFIGSIGVGIPIVFSGGSQSSCPIESDITNLRGLRNIETINRDLIISCVPDLGSLRGLDNLMEVQRLFEIRHMPGLVDFTGLERFKRQTGNFFVYSPNLASVKGLDSVYYILNLSIENFRHIEFESFSQLEEVFRFGLLGSSHFHGLPKLKKIGNTFGTVNNDSIVEFKLLNQLEQNELYSLNFASCSKLKKIDIPISFNKIQNWRLLDNSSLPNLHDFRVVRTSEDITLEKLPLLEDLTGLENITGYLREMRITEMSGLKSLDGIGFSEFSWFSIKNNPELVDIFAMDKMKLGPLIYSNEEQLRIEGNPKLSNCVNELICGLAQISPQRLFLSGNGPGCSSITEILEACALVSTDDDTDTPQASISLYPNPAHDWVMIRGAADLYSVRLLDMMGRQLRHSSSDRIDLTDLDAGMYIIIVGDQNGVLHTEKLSVVK